jgi:glucokinase
MPRRPLPARSRLLDAPPAPVLVADLGGTNTRVALADGPVLRQGSIRRYRNADHPGLTPLIRAYLHDIAAEPCAAVCLSVAGPVRDGVAQMTNLDWRLDQAELAQDLGIDRVVLLNDLQAQGYGLASLPDRAVIPVLRAPPAPASASRLVVGLGTGFNAAPVHYAAGRMLVPPSESGHIHLPRHGATEEALAAHLAARHGIATVEEALCGRGLVAVDAWLNGRPDGTPRAGEAILADLAVGEASALRTGQLYTRLLGRTLATLALTHLPFGGIYLIGGVARAFAPHLAGLGLGAAMAEMGRFSDLMGSFAVWTVSDDYAALTGCAAYLTQARPD